MSRAAIAQLGERQTEDLEVPGSIPGLGIFLRSGGGSDGRKIHVAVAVHTSAVAVWSSGMILP